MPEQEPDPIVAEDEDDGGLTFSDGTTFDDGTGFADH